MRTLSKRFYGDSIAVALVFGLTLLALLPRTAQGDVIYRETFGRPPAPAPTGNFNVTNWLWREFISTGAVLNALNGVNGTDNGKPIDVANTTSAGTNNDGTMTAYATGWHYHDQQPRALSFTPEFVFNPADYVAGSLVFSWYQGNANVAHTVQIIVRVGGVWYASAQTFANTVAVANAAAFAGGAELKTLTYNPAAANWRILNFNGDFTVAGVSTASSLGNISVGVAPGADLSGPITAFGWYTDNNGQSSNRRFDTFVIEGVPVPVGTGKPVTWTGATSADWDVTTTNWVSAGTPTNYAQGDFATFDDSLAGNSTVNVTATIVPGSLTVSNQSTAYTFGGTGTIGGTGGLTKKGAAALTILTANTYLGGTTISNGTVNIGDGGTSGSLGTGGVNNYGTLAFNRSDNITVANVIAGSGALTKNGAGALTLTGTSTFTGNSTVNAGSLILNGRLNGGGSLTTAASTTLAGSGTNAGLVDVSGALNPGTSVGTFTAGALTLQSGATATFELNTANTVGGGVNDHLQVNGNLNLNNNTITLALLTAPQVGVPYRLVTYTGTRSGTFNPAVSMAGASRLTAALDYSTPGQVNVTFSGSFVNLRWDSSGDSQWNIATTTNWVNLSGLTPDVFVDFDSVLVDDTPLQTLVDVPSGVTVRPSQIIVNTTNNLYSIGGLGSISGAGSLTKLGPASVALTGANTHSGGINVSNGSVRLIAALSGGTGPLITRPTGNLVAGAAHTNAITLAGGTMAASIAAISGFSGDVTVVTGTTSTVLLSDPDNTTLNAEMNFTGNLSGSGTVIAAAGSANTTVDAGVGFRLRGTAATTFSGTVIISNNVKGELQTTVGGPFSPGGTGKFVVVCGLYDGNNTATAPASGGFGELNIRNNFTNHSFLGNNVELAGTGWACLNPLGSAPTNAISTLGNLRIGGGQELGVIRNSGQPQVVAFQSVTLTGGDAGFSPKTPGFGNSATPIGSDLSLSNITQLSTSGVFMSGLRTLYLTGTNGYTGNTTISNGMIALIGKSSLSNSPTIAMANGGSLSVTGRTDGTLVLVNGQKLKGNGSVVGNVVAGAGSTISPGDSIGGISMSGTVLLQGSTVMEIDKAGLTNDVIQGAVNLTYGGTLVISNLNDPFVAGDAFPLFSASTYGGVFASIIPATPGPGLVWNTNTLTSDGTLRVATVSTPVVQFQGISSDGTSVVIRGTNGTAGNNYYVLASTNITLSLSNWTRLATNVFGPGGGFSFTNAITPGVPQRFYSIQLP